MNLRYSIWHLIALTIFAALLFAMFRWSVPIAQTIILVSLWVATHVLLAYRLRCYQTVFPGLVSALLAGVLLSELTGGVPLGSRWLEFNIHPVPILRCAGMITVGWLAQIQYVQVRRRQELALDCREAGGRHATGP